MMTTTTTTHIDFRTIPAPLPSLCIPRTYPNIDANRITQILNELELGEIDRIDIVSKYSNKGEKFNRIFVHFKYWFSNSNADTARERLLNGNEIKIIYDDPWFWKVSAYRQSQRFVPVAPALSRQQAERQQVPRQQVPRQQAEVKYQLEEGEVLDSEPPMIPTKRVFLKKIKNNN